MFGAGLTNPYCIDEYVTLGWIKCPAAEDDAGPPVYPGSGRSGPVYRKEYIQPELRDLIEQDDLEILLAVVGAINAGIIK